jgi:RimJ/RimL family protein N-acetyltransferase
VESAAPIVNIRGDKVALGPFRIEHVEHLERWYNDYEVMRNWGWLPGPRTAAELRRFFEPDGFFRQPENAAFAVYETASWHLVGFAGLLQIDHINRTAEFFIMIGDQQHRGRGFGTEATRLVLDHAFVGIGLSNVILHIYAYNPAGIRAYEKAGFRRIGVRRKSKFMGGQLWDTLLMDVVADDFESPVLHRILVPEHPKDS